MAQLGCDVMHDFLQANWQLKPGAPATLGAVHQATTQQAASLMHTMPSKGGAADHGSMDASCQTLLHQGF